MWRTVYCDTCINLFCVTVTQTHGSLGSPSDKRQRRSSQFSHIQFLSMKRPAPIDSTSPRAAKRQNVECRPIFTNFSIEQQVHPLSGADTCSVLSGCRTLSVQMLRSDFSESTTLDNIMWLIASMPHLYQKKIVSSLDCIGLLYVSQFPQKFDSVIVKLIAEQINKNASLLSPFRIDTDKNCKPLDYAKCRCPHLRKDFQRLVDCGRSQLLYPALDEIANRQTLATEAFKTQNKIKAKRLTSNHILQVYAKQMLEPGFSGPDEFMKYQLERIGPMMEAGTLSFKKKFNEMYLSGFAPWLITNVFGCEERRKSVESFVAELNDKVFDRFVKIKPSCFYGVSCQHCNS